MTNDLYKLHETTRNLDTARTNQTRAILTAHQNGLSLRTIAKACNLSHQTIANIIKANQ